MADKNLARQDFGRDERLTKILSEPVHESPRVKPAPPRVARAAWKITPVPAYAKTKRVEIADVPADQT